ncbi:MAG TPA: enoyl-CoA hydratase-related protein [Flavobacteriales bacterium]
MSETLQIDQQGAVVVIQLNRPAVFNSFNREMALALQSKLDEYASDDSVRAIVLTGQGKAFCAGQDLSEVVAENGPNMQTILSEHYNPIIERIRKIHKPIIAAVNGVAAGAGANIALACDIVLASEQASFIQAFSKIGLIPDSAGTFFLPRLIGFQKASALAMTGEKVTAADAERMGMIYKVLPQDTFMEEVMKLASEISQMPTYALGLIKETMNASMTNDLHAQLKLEEVNQIKAGNSEDFKEGVAAFLEKRKPVFKGK